MKKKEFLFVIIIVSVVDMVETAGGMLRWSESSWRRKWSSWGAETRAADLSRWVEAGQLTQRAPGWWRDKCKLSLTRRPQPCWAAQWRREEKTRREQTQVCSANRMKRATGKSCWRKRKERLPVYVSWTCSSSSHLHIPHHASPLYSIHARKNPIKYKTNTLDSYKYTKKLNKRKPQRNTEWMFVCIRLTKRQFQEVLMEAQNPPLSPFYLVLNKN